MRDKCVWEVQMIIGYYRKGMMAAEKGLEASKATSKCIGTREDSTGPAQRQLLLDFEEDQLCVVRQVARYGTIPGYRLFPGAGEDSEGDLEGDAEGGSAGDGGPEETEDGCA